MAFMAVGAWRRWGDLRLLALAACFSFVAGAEESKEKEEEEETDGIAASVAATLMGAVGFQMGLFYLMNHPDPDMRKYTYQVIVSTVSIFCAVLIFSCFQEVVDLMCDGWPHVLKVVVCMVHMVVWFLIMQVVLAFFSGAIFTKKKKLEKLPSIPATHQVGDRAEGVENEMEEGQEENEEEVSLLGWSGVLNLKCFSMLIAHMAGFASIKAWAELQQMAIFSFWPVAAFIPAIGSLVYQICLQQGTAKLRDWFVGKDGSSDEWESLWRDNAIEGENDVMALSVSYLTIQACRFIIGGTMPDAEGEEPWDKSGVNDPDQLPPLASHGQVDQIVLFLLGVALLLGASFLKNWLEEDERKEKEEDKVTGLNGIIDYTSAKMRIKEVCVEMAGMGFAWACYYAMVWHVAGHWHFFKSNLMIIKLAAALCSSFIAFGVIWALDKLADQDWTNENCDEVVKQAISYFGIMIGFAWEQTFDKASEEIAEAVGTEWKCTFQVCTAITCAVLFVPAWRWWLLPMLHRDGWKFGFVLDADEASNMMFSNSSDSEHKKKSWTNKWYGFVDEVQRKIKNTEALLATSKGGLQDPLLSGSGGHSRGLVAAPGEREAEREREVVRLRQENEDLKAALDGLLENFKSHTSTMGIAMTRMEEKVVHIEASRS